MDSLPDAMKSVPMAGVVVRGELYVSVSDLLSAYASMAEHWVGTPVDGASAPVAMGDALTIWQMEYMSSYSPETNLAELLKEFFSE